MLSLWYSIKIVHDELRDLRERLCIFSITLGKSDRRRNMRLFGSSRDVIWRQDMCNNATVQTVLNAGVECWRSVFAKNVRDERSRELITNINRTRALWRFYSWKVEAECICLSEKIAILCYERRGEPDNKLPLLRARKEMATPGQESHGLFFFKKCILRLRMRIAYCSQLHWEFQLP